MSSYPFLTFLTNSNNSFDPSFDKILSITGNEDYPENSEKQAKVKELERQIDQMVYKLYDLTPEEIKIVESGL